MADGIYTYISILSREFLRILDTESVRSSNTKCQIQCEVSTMGNEPHVEILFGILDYLVVVEIVVYIAIGPF